MLKWNLIDSIKLFLLIVFFTLGEIKPTLIISFMHLLDRIKHGQKVSEADIICLSDHSY